MCEDFWKGLGSICVLRGTFAMVLDCAGMKVNVHPSTVLNSNVLHNSTGVSMSTTMRAVHNYTTSGKPDIPGKAIKPQTPKSKPTVNVGKQSLQERKKSNLSKQLKKFKIDPELPRKDKIARLQHEVTSAGNVQSGQETQLGFQGKKLPSWKDDFFSTIGKFGPYVFSSIYLWNDSISRTIFEALVPTPVSADFGTTAAAVAIPAVAFVGALKLVRNYNSDGKKELINRVQQGSEELFDAKEALRLLQEEEEEQQRPGIVMHKPKHLEKSPDHEESSGDKPERQDTKQDIHLRSLIEELEKKLSDFNIENSGEKVRVELKKGQLSELKQTIKEVEKLLKEHEYRFKRNLKDKLKTLGEKIVKLNNTYGFDLPTIKL